MLYNLNKALVYLKRQNRAKLRVYLKKNECFYSDKTNLAI